MAKSKTIDGKTYIQDEAGNWYEGESPVQKEPLTAKVINGVQYHKDEAGNWYEGETILKKNDGQPLKTGGQEQPASTSLTPSPSQSELPKVKKAGGVGSQFNPASVVKEAQQKKEAQPFSFSKEAEPVNADAIRNYEIAQQFYSLADKEKAKILNANKHSIFSPIPLIEDVAGAIFPGYAKEQKYRTAMEIGQADIVLASAKKKAFTAQDAIKNEIPKVLKPMADNWAQYVNTTVDNVPKLDEFKIAAFAKKVAAQYGVPETGMFYSAIKREANNLITQNLIKPELEKTLAIKYKQQTGRDLSVDMKSESNQAALKLEELKKGAVSKQKNIQNEIFNGARGEVAAMSSDITTQVNALNDEIKVAADAITNKYSTLIKDNKFIGSQEEFAQYQQDFAAIQQKENENKKAFESINKSYLDAQNLIYTKANSRYNREAQEVAKITQAEYEKFKPKANPKMQATIEKLYGESYNEVLDKNQVLRQQSAAKNSIFDNLKYNILSSLGGQIKGWGEGANLANMATFGEYLQNSFAQDVPDFKSAKDYLDLQKDAKWAGQIIGGILPGMAAAAAVTAATGGGAAPIGFQMVSQGLAQWATETYASAGNMKADVYAATGDIAAAQNAERQTIEFQKDILPLYAFSGLPFIGKPISKMISKAVPSAVRAASPTISRLAKFAENKWVAPIIGGTLETVEELPQEYSQNLSEEAIRKEGNYKNMFDYHTKEKLENTALNIAPMFLFGAAGEVFGQSDETKKQYAVEQAAKAFALKTNFAELAPGQKEQFLFDVIQRQGAPFAAAYLTSAYGSGQMDKATFEGMQQTYAKQVELLGKTEELGLTPVQAKLFNAFSTYHENEKERFNNETDPILKTIAAARMTEYETALTNISLKKEPDYSVVTYPDNTQMVFMHSELENSLNYPAFAQAVANGDIKVAVFGQSEKLNKKIEDTTVAVVAAQKEEKKVAKQQEVATKKEIAATFNVEIEDNVGDMGVDVNGLGTEEQTEQAKQALRDAGIKIRQDDTEDISGLPSQVGEGQELVPIESQQGTGTEATGTGGVLQTQGVGGQVQGVGQKILAPVSVTNKTELAGLEERTQSDKEKSGVVNSAKNAIETLKSVFPDMDIFIHEEANAYNQTVMPIGGVENSRGNFAFERDENDVPTGKGRIDINLSNASETTIAHEVTHAILLKAFGDSPATFKQFRDRISPILRADLNKELLAFEEMYKGKAVAPEEYLTQLSALLSKSAETVEYKPSTLRKIAAVINEFVAKITGGKLQPFKGEVDFKNFVDFLNQMAQAIEKGENIENINDLGVSGIISSTGTKSKSSLSSGEIKRFPVNENVKVEEDVPLSKFNGKQSNLIESDRMTGGFIADSKGNPLFKFYGGVFYPIITGKWWASRNITKAKAIAENGNKNRDADGYVYCTPMIGSDKQHMSNIDMLSVTVELMKHDVKDKKSKVKKEDIIASLEKAFNRKGNENKKGLLKDILKNAKTIDQIFDELEYYLFQEGDKVLDRDNVPIMDEKNKPLPNFSFAQRLAIVNTILGDPKVKDVRFPSAGSITDAAKRFEEPVTSKVEAIGDVVTVMRTKGTLKYRKTESTDKFYHKSYPVEIYAVDENDNPAEIEVYVLDGAYGMRETYPSLTQSKGKVFTWDEYIKKHKKETVAIAQFNRTAKLSSATGEIKSKAQLPEQVEATAKALKDVGEEAKDTIKYNYEDSFKFNDFDWNEESKRENFREWLSDFEKKQFNKNLPKVIKEVKEDIALLKEKELSNAKLKDFEELIIPTLGNSVLVPILSEFEASVLFDPNATVESIEKGFREAKNIIDEDGSLNMSKINSSKLSDLLNEDRGISLPAFKDFVEKNPDYKGVFDAWKKVLDKNIELTLKETNAFRSPSIKELENLYKELTKLKGTSEAPTTVTSKSQLPTTSVEATAKALEESNKYVQPKENFKQSENIWTHLTNNIETIKSILLNGKFIGRGEKLENFTEEIGNERFKIKKDNSDAPYFQKGKFYGKGGAEFLITTEGDKNFIPNINRINSKNFELSQGVGVLKPNSRDLSNLKMYKKGVNGEYEPIDMTEIKKSKNNEDLTKSVNKALGVSETPTAIASKSQLPQQKGVGVGEVATIAKMPTMDDFDTFRDAVKYNVKRTAGIALDESGANYGNNKNIDELKQSLNDAGIAIEKVDSSKMMDGNYASYDGDKIKVTDENIPLQVLLHEIGEKVISDLDKSKTKIEHSNNIFEAVTTYGASRGNDAFADNFYLYFLSPETLKDLSPNVFNELNTLIPDNIKKLGKKLMDKYEATEQILKYNKPKLTEEILSKEQAELNKERTKTTENKGEKGIKEQKEVIKERQSQLPQQEQKGVGEAKTTMVSKSQKVPSDIKEYADKLAKMPESERDEIDFRDNYTGYQLYEARKIMPKKANDVKFKKVNENNSSTLYSYYEYIANVDGEPFGLMKWEDPDNPDDEEQFVWAYEKIGIDKTIESSTSDNQEIINEMQKYNAAQEVPTTMVSKSQKAKVDFGVGEEGKDNKKEFDKLTSTIPNSGEVTKYLSGETIEKYEGEKPRNEQEVLAQQLKPALERGVDIIEKAKELFGEKYIETLLQYVETENLPPANKALIYVSLENEVAKQKIENPSEAAKISKMQDLVRAKSQAFLRSNSLAINMGRLRKFAEVGYDVNKLTDRFFSSREMEDKKKIEEALQTTADDINKEAERIITDEENIKAKVDEGVKEEIQKIYENLSTEKKKTVDKRLSVLEKLKQGLFNKYTFKSKPQLAEENIKSKSDISNIIEEGYNRIFNAMKAGVDPSKAIEIGVEHIKSNIEKNSGNAWADENDFRSDMIQEFESQGLIETKPKVKGKNVVDRLEQAKQRVRNQIESLKEQIAKKERTKPKDKLKPDAELEALMKQRDALTSLLNKYLPKVNAYSEERNVKAAKSRLETEILALNRQIQKGQKDKFDKKESKENSELDTLRAEKEARQAILEALDPTPRLFIENTLIEQGFGRQINVKTKNGVEKRWVLDWKKLAGEEGSVDNIRERVESALRDKGYTEEQILRMQDAFVEEYNNLSESIVEKALNEINARNKQATTPEQKSAVRKLVEMYNYGLFNEDPSAYETALAKTVGITGLSLDNFERVRELGEVLSNLFNSNFEGKPLNESQLRTAIQVIEEKMRTILNSEAMQQGGNAFRLSEIVKGYFDASQRMMLNTVKQGMENPISGLLERFYSSIGYAGTIPDQLNAQQRKMARDIYKEMVLQKGMGYGNVGNAFISKGSLDAYVHNMSDNQLVQGIMSIAMGKTILDAVDSAYKAKITQQKFTYNLISILTRDRMVNGKLEKGMSKEEAKRYVAEKISGQSFEDAQDTAFDIIDKINTQAGKKIFNDSPEFISRLATDIVNAALVNGEKITAEMVTAAYNAAYKAAGRGLGHVANNFISEQINTQSGKLESKISEAIKQKDFKKAIYLNYFSIFYRNIANPFVGGGTNWIVLKAEKTGLGLLSGLISMYKDRGTKIDLMSETGIKELEDAMYNSMKTKDKFIRGAVGGAITILAFMLIKGTGADDEYEKWIKKNQWAKKYIAILTPEIALAMLAAKSKGAYTKYLESSFNKNEAFDKGKMAIKAASYLSAGETEKAAGQAGQLVGASIGNPVPWRLVRDAQQVWVGATGGEPYAVNPTPSNTFMEGYLKGGFVDYLGYAPTSEDKSTIVSKDVLESPGYKIYKDREIKMPKIGNIGSYNVPMDAAHPEKTMTPEEFGKFSDLVKSYELNGWEEVDDNGKTETHYGLKEIPGVTWKIKEKGMITEEVATSALSNEELQNKVNQLHGDAIEKAKQDLGLAPIKKTRRRITSL